MGSEWKAATRHIHGGLVAGSGAVTAGLWFVVWGVLRPEKGIGKRKAGAQ